MEKIATATYSFEKLRRAGYVYVDKTDMLWRLVSETEDSQFFIARPRRFAVILDMSGVKGETSDEPEFSVFSSKPRNNRKGKQAT